MFTRLREELEKMIAMQEWVCAEAIQKRYNFFHDQVKVLDAAHNTLQQRIYEYVNRSSFKGRYLS
jgi:hypothetical protein